MAKLIREYQFGTVGTVGAVVGGRWSRPVVVKQKTKFANRDVFPLYSFIENASNLWSQNISPPDFSRKPLFVRDTLTLTNPDFSFPLFSVTKPSFEFIRHHEFIHDACAKRLKARTNEHYCNIRPPKS